MARQDPVNSWETAWKKLDLPGGISLKHPASWEAIPEDDVMSFVPQDETPMSFHVTVYLKPDGQAPDAAVQRFFQDRLEVFPEIALEQSRHLQFSSINDNPAGSSFAKIEDVEYALYSM